MEAFLRSIKQILPGKEMQFKAAWTEGKILRPIQECCGQFGHAYYWLVTMRPTK